MTLPIYHVHLTDRRGAFKPCMWCKGDRATFDIAPVFEPARPAAKVVCEGCGRQTAWANERQVRKAQRLTGERDANNEATEICLDRGNGPAPQAVE